MSAKRKYVEDAEDEENERTENLTLQKIQRNYSLRQNWAFDKANSGNELRIVMLGKTGVGKSATANTILGKTAFKEDVTTASVTKASYLRTSIVNGRKVSVIDTPGLQDCERPVEEVLGEIARVVKMFRQGIHVFVYVLNLADSRFTEEDKKSMYTIEMMFGGKMKKHRLLVYTHAESRLNDTMTLTKFLEKQTCLETFTEEFFKDFNDDIVAVNNKGKVRGEKQRNQNAILAMVDNIKKQNNNKVYTNEMFKKANVMWKEYTQRLTKDGLSLAINDTIEKVLAEYPETATDRIKLKQKVKEKFEEELEQLEEARFNMSMEDLQDEINSVQEQDKKRKRRNDGNVVKKNMKEKLALVASSNFEKQVEEIAESHEGYFKRFYEYVKRKWNSLFS